MGFFTRRKGVLKGAIVLVLSTVLLFAWVVPAQALIPFPILYIQLITGTVNDAGTTAHVPGIVVSAYDASTHTYVWSTVTAADGSYGLWLAPGTYKIQFRDPSNRYGEQWGWNQANFEDASDQVLSSGVNTDMGVVQLRPAATIKTIVRRAGHPLTTLPGQFLILQQKSALSTLQQWSATTGGGGAYSWPGMRTYSVTYLESAIDPTGRFYAADSTTGWHSVVGGTTTTTYVDLSPAGSSREVTPSVPATKKSTQKKNKYFTVTGTFSKPLANGKQITILAVKGSVRKTFAGKIKSNKYSASVKLAKGTWKLYALFGGNATFAANDSLSGKTVTTK
jgi:hypothetical protein